MVLAAIALAAVVVGLLAYLTIGQEKEAIEGKVEVDEYRVESNASARILDILVREGDHVHVGDTLVILEVSDAEAKKIQPSSARDASSAKADVAQDGDGKEQIKVAYEMWQQAKMGLESQRQVYERVKRLYEEGELSEQGRDEAYANYKVYEAQEKTAKRQYDMAVSGARRQGNGVAEAQSARAKDAGHDMASYITETVLTAKTEGEVATIYVKAGDSISSGAPVMTIGMLKDCWCAFDICEGRLDGLKVGDTFKAYVPAFSKKLLLKVYVIKAQGGNAASETTKSNGQGDGRTYKVKARPVEEFDGLLPGMSVVIRGSLSEKK